MTPIYAIVIALAVAMAFMAMLIVGLLRSHAEILRKLHSLGAGLEDGDSLGEHRLTLQSTKGATVQAPSIVGVNPDGEPVALAPQVGPNPLLIAFLSTSCSSCTVFWENLDRSEMIFGDQRHRVVLTTLGPEEESPTRAQMLARGSADVVMSSQAWEEYEVPGAPYFVVTDPELGVVGEGSAETFDALLTFLHDSSNDRRWDQRFSDAESGPDRADRIDRDLRDAGIHPGDPRLHHNRGEIDDAPHE